jgi:hypothetical protein
MRTFVDLDVVRVAQMLDERRRDRAAARTVPGAR